MLILGLVLVLWRTPQPIPLPVLKQVAKLRETGLHGLPGRVRAETKNLALALVFTANRGREVSRRKERVAIGKAHLIRVEVATWKVCPADAVVVLLDLAILGRLQHF